MRAQTESPSPPCRRRSRLVHTDTRTLVCCSTCTHVHANTRTHTHVHTRTVTDGARRRSVGRSIGRSSGWSGGWVERGWLLAPGSVGRAMRRRLAFANRVSQPPLTVCFSYAIVPLLTICEEYSERSTSPTPATAARHSQVYIQIVVISARES